MRKPLARFQKGLSLVELMIAITLGLILTAGVLQLFLSNNQTFRTQQATSRVQESGRLAAEFLASDIRMAGFTGFRGRLSAVQNKVIAAGYQNKYENGIEFISAANAATLAPIANTNVLILRGAIDGVGAPLLKAAEAGKFTVSLLSEKADSCSAAGASTSYNGLCIGEAAYIADYQKTFVFSVSGLNKLNATTLEVSYVGSWGGNNIDPDEYFVEGAVVSPAREVVYFIRNGMSGRPSLFQKVNSEAAVELLEGVSDIALFYNRDATKNVYVTALDQLGGLWNNQTNPIVSVRLELVVQSIADNVLEDEQTYTLGAADVVAADKRLYKVFSTTVALRNQLP
jgi:type IV pilus assembly protein PilW